MKMKIMSTILCFFLSIFPIKAIAEQPSNLVEDFHSFPVDVLSDGKTYSGMLLSEIEYDRMVQVEADLLSAEEKIKIYENSDKKQMQLLEKWDVVTEDIKGNLKSVEKQLEKPPSFWNEHKFEFGLGIGALAAILIFVAAK